MKKTFNTEVRIGSIRGIEKTGPRVLAYRTNSYGGNYIMNHAKMGVSRARIIPLSEVRRTLKPRMWEKIKEKVRQFQKITNGQHGDLHGKNILIVQIPRRHGKTKTYIKIIDYGAHRRFKELKKARYYKVYGGMKVYRFDSGQNFIKNKNWLKTLKTR
jgi:hypothetical protein